MAVQPRRRTLWRVLAISLSSIAAAAVAASALAAWPSDRKEDTAERLPPVLLEGPPLASTIRLATSAEAERRRELLVRLVFGRAALPERLPIVERGVEDGDFASGLGNLDRIDRLTIPLPLGFSSVAYHALPARANGRLVLYHNGHHPDFLDGKDTVAYFLARGYSVLVLAMPFTGHNESPDAFTTPRCGRVELRAKSHDSFACMARPLRYFVEPIAVALNHASRLGYGKAAMIGLSGGGWTTVLYAALDPRIVRSYPVAATWPLAERVRTCAAVGGDVSRTLRDCGQDFEQWMPPLYRLANYETLYVLGGWGAGRKQLAIYNVHDPCCFQGTGYLRWAPPVEAAVRRLGTGAFATAGDTSHSEHAISPFALGLIERDVRAGLPARTPCRGRR